MAGNSFNSEIVGKLKEAKEQFIVAKERLAKGINSAVEDVAEPSGIPNLVKSARNMKEAGDSLGKVMGDNIESLGSLIKHYEDLNEAFGA